MKLLRQFYEEKRLKDSRLSSVLALEAEIDRHGLRWLSQKLGQYATNLVREFYTSCYATIP